mmetsp:Transcript_31259/g.85867  ORF Transcript_31259/g.85867 Transcript_31259/m.85867 type:complete len:1142 (-) Transcript_31259:187-3612(-)
MVARRPLPTHSAAFDRWCRYAAGEVSHLVEATDFAHFDLSFDGAQQRRRVSPEHYIVSFASPDKGRQRSHSSLLSLRLKPEDSLPEQVKVGVEVCGRDGESVVCSGEVIEFELLSSVNDASKQPPLRICAGPVRINAETGNREFMRIDLGRCVRQIVTDVIDDPMHKGQRLVRSRWWICVEVLRLVCVANSLDCVALDVAGERPLQWVLCLIEEKPSTDAGASATQEERSIDELARYIDGGKAKKPRPKKKKKGAGDASAAGNDGEGDASECAQVDGGAAYTSLASVQTRAEEAVAAMSAVSAALSQATSPRAPVRPQSSPHVGVGDGGARSEVMRAGAMGPPSAKPMQAPSRPEPPPGWSRTVELAPALVDFWRDYAGCDIHHIVESTGLVHFMLSFNAEKCCRFIAPTHHIVAFPQLVAGQQRYSSALLVLRIVTDTGIPESTADGAESIEFELLTREHEACAQTPLQLTAGPVRINEKLGQRESMRLDLRDCVRWADPDSVNCTISGTQHVLVRQRWWISVETLKLICLANQLDIRGLDVPGAAPLEWIACLVDHRAPLEEAALLREQRGIAGLIGDGIDCDAPPGMSRLCGQSIDAQKTKATKKKNKEQPVQIPGPRGADALASPIAARSGGGAAPPPAQASPRQEAPTATSAGPMLPASQSVQVPPQPQRPRDSKPDAVSEAAPCAVPAPADEKKQPNAAKRSQGAPASAAYGRAFALPTALIDSWCQVAKKNVSHVVEAAGFVHFALSYDGLRKARTITPEHYIIAFPNRDKGRQKYHSSLLALRVVSEAAIPSEYVPPPSMSAECSSGPPDYVEFELLSRVQEAPVQQQLRITAGPVRLNPETGQHESMRMDLGRCLRQIATDVVDDPRGKRMVRSRWWVCVDMLRLICTANALDCGALDGPGHTPMEWVVCLVDDRFAPSDEVQPQPEERVIDDLVDFIDGKGSTSKKKKKKNKDKAGCKTGADEGACGGGADEFGGHGGTPLAPDFSASSLTASLFAANLSASQTAAASLSRAPPPPGMSLRSPFVDPVIQAQAAAHLLAECAASCAGFQQAAAAAAAASAAEAARKTAEVAAGRFYAAQAASPPSVSAMGERAPPPSAMAAGADLARHAGASASASQKAQCSDSARRKSRK